MKHPLPQHRRLSPVRIGLFGIGLEAYWAQFPALKERVEGHLAKVAKKLARNGVKLVNAGLVDNEESARCAGSKLRRAEVELIFLYPGTYALSSTVLTVVRHARIPVIILNLACEPAIDYASFNKIRDRTRMTGEWLAYCSACPVPEIANVFNRAGVHFHEITGVLGNDPACWGEVDGWIDAARVAFGMSNNRLGLMGHYYGGMLDIYTDLTLQCATFGTHIEMIEIEELAKLRGQVGKRDLANRVGEFYGVFDIQPGCARSALIESARTSLALDALVERHKLGSMAYFQKGTGVPACEAVVSSIILGASLLTGRGIPVAGEYEVKNAQAMKIMDLFGVGGAFTEYYAMDFNDDVVLMGHDGPGHVKISQGKTKVRPLGVYHGKVGHGVSVEMAVRHGPVTLLSVIETFEGKLALLCAEAESVPGPILEIGNTNSRYRFPCGARTFVNRWNSHGPAHHWAIGIGHIANRIEKLGQILGLQSIRVC